MINSNEGHYTQDGFDQFYSPRDCPDYRRSAELTEAQALHERTLFRYASELHHRLTTTGGFTWHPDNRTPVTGYIVSDGRHELRVRTVTVETIYRYLLAHWDHVMSRDNLYFGAWQSSYDLASDYPGYVYLDISEHFGWREQAVNAATERHERAIWSLHEGKSIEIN